VKALLQAKKDEKKNPPPKKKKKDPAIFWESFNTISIKQLRNLLKKIPLDDMDDKDVQPFITACIKACGNNQITQELLKWGASSEQIENENDHTPYFLIEACEKYGTSKYLRKAIEHALIPEKEILAKIKEQKTIVEIDYKAMRTNTNALQFLTTGGVRSASQLVSDVLQGRLIYVENEKKHYFFNGHVWTREPDIAGIAYSILANVLRYFLGTSRAGKTKIYELLLKIEARRFRVELAQDLSGLKPEVFRENVLFDGPTVQESLTLIDGVMDFSGNKIVFRKSTPEEYRRDVLPYRMEAVEKAIEPSNFLAFMQSNFKNKETL